MTHKQYGTIGVIGVGLFVLALIGLHILDSDLSVVDEYVSVYALGDHNWVSRAADLAMGLGIIAIALGLRKTLARGKRVTASWVLVLVAGFGFIVSGIFNTDPTNTTDATISGALHDLGGYISMLSLMIATWLLRGVFKRDEEYSVMSRTQTRFAVLMTGALGAFIAFEAILGLTQRLLIAVVATWLMTLAINIRQTAKHRSAR
jgi:hypothetical protein